MIGLNNIATLYAFKGQYGGKPAFAEKGKTFSCRCEPAYQHAASGRSIEETADTLFFARDLTVKPGDRIIFDGRKYLVKTVDVLRAMHRIHHLEIYARAEAE